MALNDKKARLEEVESMLRDPLLTQTRKEALLAEKAALSAADFEGPASTGGPQSSSEDKAQVASVSTNSEANEQQGWRAGLSTAKESMWKLSRLAIGSTASYENDVPEQERLSAKWKGGALAGVVLHTGLAAGAGFAMGGPVGAIAGLIINGVTGDFFTTVALVAVPAAAGVSLRVAEVGAGLVDRLHEKRSVAKSGELGTDSIDPEKSAPKV